MGVTPDDAFIADVLRRLVQINSVNPHLDASAPGEADIVTYLDDVLNGLGIPTRIFEFAPHRPSIVGTVAGVGGGKSLMLNAHIDTVATDGMADPFGATVRDGKMYGRGSYDMKGAMAACIGAVKALRDAGVVLLGDVIVAGVADEEYGSVGTAGLVEVIRVDAAIVTEPTHLQTCLAHKGYVWVRLHITGRAAHGSRFEEGIDANLRMGRVLQELAVLERQLRESEPHPLVGPPSIHAPLISGGTGISTYADSCVLQIERRTIPGETVEDVERQLREVVDRARAEDTDFDVSLETFFVREPFEVPPGAAIVRALDVATERHLGEVAVHIGDAPWMDAALLSAAGVETVVFGPSGGGAHASEEWVDIDSVFTVAGILAETAIDYCGTA